MTNDDDVFYRISMIMNVDPAEIAKIVHDYIERDIGYGYDRLNCPKPPIYIGPVKVKSLKEKIDNYKRRKKEMKTTSVQNIKNVKDVCFDISNDPIERKSKLTIVASTNDDIFAFEFEGPDLLQSCKRAGLFSNWEKDQKIRELEKDLDRWKKEAADCLKLRDEAQKEAYKLKKENEKYEEKIKKFEHDNMLDKNAADYWSNEHDILLKRFAKLQVENEKLKEENERIKENLNSQHEMIKELNQKNLKLQEEKDQKIRELEEKLNAWKKEASDCLKLRDEVRREKNEEINKLHQQLHQAEHDKKSLTWKNEQLTQENEKLKELKTPTIENFANEEPSSRSDILDLAKKCVCGQREQDYGSPESNFQLIADLWNQYLFKEPGAKEVFGIGPMDVAMMMGLMKIARIRNGGGSGDSFVDLAGYAACGGEIWHSNKETNGDSN